MSGREIGSGIEGWLQVWFKSGHPWALQTHAWLGCLRDPTGLLRRNIEVLQTNLLQESWVVCLGEYPYKRTWETFTALLTLVFLHTSSSSHSERKRWNHTEDTVLDTVNIIPVFSQRLLSISFNAKCTNPGVMVVTWHIVKTAVSIASSHKLKHNHNILFYTIFFS